MKWCFIATKSHKHRECKSGGGIISFSAIPEFLGIWFSYSSRCVRRHTTAILSKKIASFWWKPNCFNESWIMLLRTQSNRPQTLCTSAIMETKLPRVLETVSKTTKSEYKCANKTYSNLYYLVSDYGSRNEHSRTLLLLTLSLCNSSSLLLCQAPAFLCTNFPISSVGW